MEDRYEIRGKIGQGGLGSVYRAYDRKMNREVAIKRITSGGEEGLAEEATRQLLKEAGALASLQHPHIVTVHDFGSDEDGPYVVMELIAGKTLDAIIEHAPLTWPDFRELALQTQEALIAAQDLDLIHSDLKPSNLMLTWLPSGKFQVKVVDFGLAVLTQSQCRKEIEAMDAVFGSIFFMPPEQFERQLLNPRSDMYSIGCVYYQALTGHYPFTGLTANEVMEAHLQHRVINLDELRDDIPQWVCDWVMWHINRYSQDRPETAREALALFLQNDRIPNPPLSRGKTQSQEPKRPKLIIPSGGTHEQTAAQHSHASAPALQIPSTQTANPFQQPAAPAVPAQEASPGRPRLVIPGMAAPPQEPAPATYPQPSPPQAYAETPAQSYSQPQPEQAATQSQALPPQEAAYEDSQEISNDPSPLTAAVFSQTGGNHTAQQPVAQPQSVAPATQLPPQPTPSQTASQPVATVPSIPSYPNQTPAPIPQTQAQPVALNAPAVPAPQSQPSAPAVSTPVTTAPPSADSPVNPEGDETTKITSKTRAYVRPKLVLGKRSADEMDKTQAYALNAITGLQPTIPTATTPYSVIPTATTPQSVIPAPVTAQHALPQQPAVPVSAPSPSNLVSLASITSQQPLPAAPTPAPTTLPAQPVSPQPLQPPVGSKPSIHTTTSTPEPVMVAPVATGPKTQVMAKAVGKTAQVATAPTSGANPSATTSPVATPAAPKRGLSNAAKGMIATILVILIVIMSWVIMDRMSSNRNTEALQKILIKAAQPDTKEIPVSKKELSILLESAVNVSLNKDRNTIYKALLLAKTSDNNDIDSTITQFVTTREMLPEVKEVLIKDVLRLRGNAAVVPTLLTFASTTGDNKAAANALKAIRAMAEDREFEPLLKIVQNTSNAEVRGAAEATLAEVIRKSSNKDRLAETLALQYSTALNQEVRHCLLRLMGVCGGQKALSTVRDILNGTDQQQIIAAMGALGAWGDASGFPVLVEFLKQSRDPNMRTRAFDTAEKWLALQKDNPKEEEQWTLISNEAKTKEEQKKIIQGIANLDGDWPLKLVQAYMKSDDDEVAAKAKRALDHMQDMRKLKQ